jgi:hypothetical protein
VKNSLRRGYENNGTNIQKEIGSGCFGMKNEKRGIRLSEVDGAGICGETLKPHLGHLPETI